MVRYISYSRETSNRKDKKMNIKLQTETPQFTDLVSNFQLFHNIYDKEKLLELPSWEDHSNNGFYNNYPHINEFLSKDLTEEDLNQSHIVRIPTSYIWSSEESLGGFDRPIWTSIKGDKQCRENLNNQNGSRSSKKGYRPEDAQILAAYLRPCEENNTYQIVKFLGNNRVWMKLLVNRGEDSEVLVNIRFHKEGKREDYIRKESESHSTDAGDRSGQNEKQKFVSSYRAGRPQAVACFNFLKKHKLEYKNIMLIEGIRNENEKWLQLSSLQGIKDGLSNGFFWKYGENSVDAAINIVKKIEAEITKEEIVGSTPIECFAQLHHIFTTYGWDHRSTGLFTTEEISHFAYILFEEKNQCCNSLLGETADLKLSSLSVSQGVKDVTYINAMTFWPYIVEYWKNINGKQKGFSFRYLAIEKFLESCKDRFLLGAIKSKLAA